jgi:hypothetical protein
MKILAQHLRGCALDRLGCVSISGSNLAVYWIGNARNSTFYNTAMGLIAISFLKNRI